LYFTHAFNSCVMGYMDLGLKIAEVIVYAIVMASLGILKMFPWRKKAMNDKIAALPENEDQKFVKAGIIVLEAGQTILDLPFLVLTLPLFVLTPHRSKIIVRSFKVKPASEWRLMIIMHYAHVVTDVPFILMLLILCVTVFMAFKLKKSLSKRVSENDKLPEKDRLDYEYLVRKEIWHQFRKLILVYIIGLACFVLLNIAYFATMLLVPLRFTEKKNKITVIYQKIRLNYKGKQDLK